MPNVRAAGCCRVNGMLAFRLADDDCDQSRRPVKPLPFSRCSNKSRYCLRNRPDSCEHSCCASLFASFRRVALGSSCSDARTYNWRRPAAEERCVAPSAFTDGHGQGPRQREWGERSASAEWPSVTRGRATIDWASTHEPPSNVAGTRFPRRPDRDSRAHHLIGSPKRPVMSDLDSPEF
jgi:hypothetical protein